MTDLLDPTIRGTYDSDEPPSWDATVQQADTGPVQVRTKRSKPRHLVTMVWDKSVDQGGQLDALDDFFRAHCNPFVPIYLYTPSMWRRWLNIAAGTGDGTTLNFPFAGREVDPGSETVTVAGVVKTSGVDYTLGYDGMDTLKRQRIQFLAGHAPAGAAAVVISYRGRRLLLATLLDDPDGPRIAGFRRLKYTVAFSGEEV